MFTANNLKQNPYVSKEMDYPHIFVAPPIDETSCSDWLLLAIENDEVEKIYAMRVLPLHDIIAVKVKYKEKAGPSSEIIMRPELILLKHIWDCNNTEFCLGVEHYMKYSKHCLHQFTNKPKFPLNSIDITQWYYSIISGNNV